MDSPKALTTIPATASHCTVQAEAQVVRYRLDAGTPTASLGQRLLLTTIPLELNREEMVGFRGFEEAGGGFVNVHYYDRS